MPADVPAAPAAAAEPAVDAAEPALIVFEPFGPQDPCRTPRSDGEPWEAALAAANAAAVAGARTDLGTVLGDIDELLDAPWASPPRRLPRAGTFLGAADPERLLDELLTDHHLAPERILVTADGGAAQPGALGTEPLEFGMSRPILANLVAHVRSGGGASISGVDRHDHHTSAAVERIERIAGTAVRADLGLVGPGPGLSHPADEATRVVLAVDRPLRVEAGQASVPGRATPPMPSSLAVEPGDGVAVPAGWGTRITSADGRPALATVVVIPVLTLHTMARAISDEVVFWPLLRADLPIDRSGPQESYGGSVFEGGRFGAALADVVDDATVDRLLARFRARVPARWTGRLTRSVAVVERPPAATRLRVPLPGGIVAGPVETAGSPSIYGGGRRVRVALEALPAVAHLADGRAHEVAELTSFAPTDEAGAPWSQRLARNLLQTGLAEVVA